MDRPSITVAITGSTGLIGSALVARLEAAGHTVRRVTRGGASSGSSDIRWDPDRAELDPAALRGCKAVVHLAGEPIAQRWTAERKQKIRESRIRGTALMANSIAKCDGGPSVLLSGSAIGYYGDRGDEQLDERSTSGADFLAGVVRDWEAATGPAESAGIRVVHLRTGLVLSPDGGALGKLLTPFRLGLGGPMGSGTQWMSWITLEDHLRSIEHGLFDEELRGPVNLVAPDPVQNAAFATALGRALHRPTVIPTPAFALELMFGEMARATILSGQRVAPTVLLDRGFTFAHSQLDEAFAAILPA